MNPTSGVIREAWTMYKAHWRHLIPIAFVVYLLLSLFTLVLVLLLGRLGVIAAGFVSLAGIFWLQGTLVVGIEDVRDGRADLSISETLSHVRPRLNTLAVAGILAALTISVGFLLLIVPGLLLLTWWILIVPVIVLEGTGIMVAFGRSRELVSGYGWGVFGVIILTVLVLIAISIAASLLSLLLTPLEDWLQEFLARVVSNSLTAPFAALAWTLLYYRLRDAREPEPGGAVAAA